MGTEESSTRGLPLADLLLQAATTHPDRPGIVFPETEHSYESLLEDAMAAARSLYSLGVRVGDNVGLLMPSCPEYVAGFFGASLIGCTVVPLNARFRARELSYVIDNAELVAILTTDRVQEHADFTEILVDSLPSLRSAGHADRLRLDEAPHLRHIAMLSGAGRRGILGREQFEAAAAGTPAARIDAERATGANDIALILYTSGTTAHPKGCMISNRAVVRGCIERIGQNVRLVDHNVFWSAGPLSHIASLQVFLASVSLAGTFATDIFFDAARAARLIADYSVTSAWPWFPAIMQDLYAQDSFVPADTHITSLMLVGPEALLRRVSGDFPLGTHLNSCGMTETAGIYAMSWPEDSVDERATSGGRPLKGYEVRIIDPETGERAALNERGELLVRGYSLMSGYFKDPQKTSEALDADGWLHTGDLYSASETGHLTFHGRLKDMLKVGGENLPAVEVEAFLATHPAVKVAEVVGRPDPRLDEVPVAFVELKPGWDVGAEELIEHCRGRIASFKVPRAVFLKRTEEWPMSATKVNKNALRAELEAHAKLPAG